MAARAIWKGVIQAGSHKLPVKLYSAVQDRTMHFRLLHKSDRAPVKQQLISSDTTDAVDYEATRKAFRVSPDRFVVLEDEELEALAPKASRDIEVEKFVDRKTIDPRWYSRAYWLAPDGDTAAYFAFAAALQKRDREGIARWVMRDKEYIGALRGDSGYLMLIVFRFADEIISASSLQAPEGRQLEKRELEMGKQLIEGLSGTFDARQYHDEYRARVMELVEAKAKGKRPKVEKFRPRKTSEDALTGALAASLKGLQKKKVASGSR